MTIREFQETIEFNIEHNLKHSILGLGAPGVGKSQIIRRIGKKYGYCDMFPVSGAEEAEQLNRDFDGYQIEVKFQGKYLVHDNNHTPHWMRDMTDY